MRRKVLALKAMLGAAKSAEAGCSVDVTGAFEPYVEPAGAFLLEDKFRSQVDFACLEGRDCLVEFLSRKKTPKDKGVQNFLAARCNGVKAAVE